MQNARLYTNGASLQLLEMLSARGYTKPAINYALTFDRAPWTLARTRVGLGPLAPHG